MGMFDDLTVEYPLPDGLDASGLSFQTKDTAEQWLTRYVLREDGTLLNTRTGEPEEHHGALEFYTGNWSGSCGNLYMTGDDQPPWRAEYVALFDHGKLIKIEGGKSLVQDVEHVLRVDFQRRCDALRREPAPAREPSPMLCRTVPAGEAAACVFLTAPELADLRRLLQQHDGEDLRRLALWLEESPALSEGEPAPPPPETEP